MKAMVNGVLLDLDLGARCFELLLDVLGLFLADVLFDRLGSAFDQVLGFLETQSGDLADGLDDVDLVGTTVGENDGELRLLFDSSSNSAAASGSSHGDRSRADAPLRLELFDELGDLDHREVGEEVDDLITSNFSHFSNSYELINLFWKQVG